MTALADRRQDSLAPAFAAAIALHIGLAVLATLSFHADLPVGGTAVPITIVASGPTTDSRPAEAAPETQAAQTEAPVPEAKPPPPPPPTHVAKAAPPKIVTPTPKAVTPTPRPVPDTFNLDKLAESIARTTHPTPPRPSAGARGPARAETAPLARVDAGQGVSQSDISGLSQLLERLWNPNCDVVGGDAVIIPVRFAIDDDGHVVGRISESGREGSADPVVATAARRAIDAIHQAEPYGPAYRGKAFTVNFDAKTACAKN